MVSGNPHKKTIFVVVWILQVIFIWIKKKLIAEVEQCRILCNRNIKFDFYALNTFHTLNASVYPDSMIYCSLYIDMMDIFAMAMIWSIKKIMILKIKIYLNLVFIIFDYPNNWSCLLFFSSLGTYLWQMFLFQGNVVSLVQ